MSKNTITMTLPSDYKMHRSVRRIWAIRPTERVVESKKIYKRKKITTRNYDEF